MKYILTMIMVALLASTAFADTSVDLDGNGYIDEAFGGTNVGSVYSPIVQALDPTVLSDNGVYFATTSQKMFIKDNTFLWASSAGTYTLIEEVVVPEYTLNLNISGVTGADAINGFTTSQVITGLTSDYTITGTLGDSTDLACTGTGVSGSGLSYLASTASADVTAECVFSVASGVTAIFHDEMDSVANPHTSLDGTSVTVSGTPTISGDGVDFDDIGEMFQSSTVLSADAGTIVVTMAPHETGNPSVDRTIYASSGSTVYLRREAGGIIRARYGAKSLIVTGTSYFTADTPVTLRYTWERSVDDVNLALYVDENATPVVSSTVAEVAFSDTTYMRLGTLSTVGASANAVITDFVIYDTVVTP